MQLGMAREHGAKRQALDWLRTLDREWAEGSERFLTESSICAIGCLNGVACYVMWICPLGDPVAVPSSVSALAPEPAAWICGLYVPHSLRGRSIARLMGAAVLCSLHDEGWRSVVGAIRYDNVASFRLHSNLGFEPIAVATRGRLLGTRWYERVSTDPAKVERLWQQAIKRT